MPMMRICHNEDDTVFGCVGCQRKCRTRAGEAAHMFRVHQQVSGLRLLADEPTCSACLKKLSHHGEVESSSLLHREMSGSSAK